MNTNLVIAIVLITIGIVLFVLVKLKKIDQEEIYLLAGICEIIGFGLGIFTLINLNQQISKEKQLTTEIIPTQEIITPTITPTPTLTPTPTPTMTSTLTPAPNACGSEIEEVIKQANQSQKDYMMGKINLDSLDKIWSGFSIERVKYNVGSLKTYGTDYLEVGNILSVDFDIIDCIVIEIYSDTHIQIQTEEIWNYDAEIFCKSTETEQEQRRSDEFPYEEYHLHFVNSQWIIREWIPHRRKPKLAWICP